MSKTSKFNRCGRWGLANRIFWGLFFLAIAAAVVCNAFGVITFGINFAIVIVAIILTTLIFKSLFRLMWPGVFIPLAGLVTILGETTDWFSLTGQNIGALFLSAFLLSVAFTIMFRRKHGHFHEHLRDHRHMMDGEHFDKIINDHDESDVEVDVRLGSTIKYINSDNFESAKIKCYLGAVKVYFDSAKLGKKNEAEIYIDALMSGIELYIPKDWTVVNNTSNTMSGVNEKNAPHSDGKKTVTLSGNLNMSGVEIIYV
jgi:predicted membrane protein